MVIDKMIKSNTDCSTPLQLCSVNAVLTKPKKCQSGKAEWMEKRENISKNNYFFVTATFYFRESE